MLSCAFVCFVVSQIESFDAAEFEFMGYSSTAFQNLCNTYDR